MVPLPLLPLLILPGIVEDQNRDCDQRQSEDANIDRMTCNVPRTGTRQYTTPSTSHPRDLRILLDIRESSQERRKVRNHDLEAYSRRSNIVRCKVVRKPAHYQWRAWEYTCRN